MNSAKEKHYLIGENDLPIVLVHGTMGKSEDWSRVVEKLSNSRSVIRPNYIERVARTNSTNELAIKDLADEVVAAVRAEVSNALILLAVPLERQLPHASQQSIRRWSVRLYSYQVSALEAIRG
jgi:hypothetical protein